MKCENYSDLKIPDCKELTEQVVSSSAAADPVLTAICNTLFYSILWGHIERLGGGLNTDTGHKTVLACP